MCGIVGYVGNRAAPPILLEGLRRLEYRGYDSAGMAVFDGDRLQVERCKGKLVNLQRRLEKSPMAGSIGIGHTRWATHGSPSEENAHPHRCDRVIVVHNGIIENYLELKKSLSDSGSAFSSQTDTEVIPHLIEQHYQQHGDMAAAVRACVNRLEGSFAIVVLSGHDRRTLFAAKKRSPLVVGLGEGETFVASDIPAILDYTDRVIILEDGDFARIDEKGVQLSDFNGAPRHRQQTQITWTAAMAEKEGYKHFMLKEIHEQPRAVVNTLQGRINQPEQRITIDEEIGLTVDAVAKLKRIVIVACGTSWHAGLYGKYVIECMARISVEVDLASEFRYRQPILDAQTLVIGISQSGETADTLAALEAAKELGAQVLSICNVIGSSIPRASDFTLYTHAGPEIGVASTKAFTTQLTALYLLAVKLAELKGAMDLQQIRRYVHDLVLLPHHLEDTLEQSGPVIDLAKRFFQYSDFLYLGRGLGFPVALEGALKLKEISYIHAEAYPGGEIKHGPIALIDDTMPVLVVASGDETFDKVLANLNEVKTRGAITILCIGNQQLKRAAQVPGVDHMITTPDTNRFLMPIVQTVPLQLFAYHVAVLRGTDVDQPRNLAKSVTVE